MALSKCRYFILSFNISAVYIALGLLLSLQPPFYPSEAAKMGATPSQCGFVFGIANLSLFLFSPVFGKFGARIGAKVCFTVGAVIQGVSGFLFAFLTKLTTTGTFIGFSYLLRFLEGMGTAMAWSAALGILMKIFPNRVARVMSWTQTCFGLGYMLGPAVGAALYDVGGFMLPFLIIGSLSTILSLTLIVTIPSFPSEQQQVNGDAENSELITENPPVLRYRTLFTSLSLLLPFVDLFSALCGNGMLESMLEPHLKLCHASTMQVGLAFLIFGLCYMLGNMLFGAVMDKVGNPIMFSILGNIFFLVVFIFIGPVPFIGLEPSTILIQCMMALAGVAYAALVVSSFSRAQKRVLEMGFADDINTYVMISGIWMSAFALGNFAGPTLAGVFVDTEGFPRTTILFFGLYVIMLTIDIIQAFTQTVRHRRERGYQQI